jgi:hypothetical protein
MYVVKSTHSLSDSIEDLVCLPPATQIAIYMQHKNKAEKYNNQLPFAENKYMLMSILFLPFAQ